MLAPGCSERAGDKAPTGHLACAECTAASSHGPCTLWGGEAPHGQALSAVSGVNALVSASSSVDQAGGTSAASVPRGPQCSLPSKLVLSPLSPCGNGKKQNHPQSQNCDGEQMELTAKPVFLPEGWERGSTWQIPPGTQCFPDAHTRPEVSLNPGKLRSLRARETRGPFFYLWSDHYSIVSPSDLL